MPVMVYVAANLSHPHLEEPGLPGSDEPPSQPTRVVLLEWLAALAYEADDYLRAATRSGGDPVPEISAFLDLRPGFYTAVRPFLDHPDPDVRHAAVVAAAPLIKHPELAEHRDPLASRMRRLLAVSTRRYQRNRAFDALLAWRHDAAELVTPDDLAAFERYAHNDELRRQPPRFTPDPPF